MFPIFYCTPKQSSKGATWDTDENLNTSNTKEPNGDNSFTDISFNSAAQSDTKIENCMQTTTLSQPIVKRRSIQQGPSYVDGRTHGSNNYSDEFIVPQDIHEPLTLTKYMKPIGTNLWETVSEHYKVY